MKALSKKQIILVFAIIGFCTNSYARKITESITETLDGNNFVTASCKSNIGTFNHSYVVLKPKSPGPHKLISVTPEIITRQNDENGFDYKWDGPTSTFTAHLWARATENLCFGYVNLPPDSGIQVRFKVIVANNRCSDPEEVDLNVTKVGEAKEKFQKVINSMSCYEDLPKNLHKRLIKQFKDNANLTISKKIGNEKYNLLDKQVKLARINKAMAKFEQAVKKISVEYKNLIVDFDEDRKTTGATLSSSLSQISLSAKSDDLKFLNVLIEQLISIQNKSLSHDSEILFKINKVFFKIKLTHDEFDNVVSEYINFMQEEMINPPKNLSEQLNVLRSMKGSINERSKTFLIKITDLINSIRSKQVTLQNISIDNSVTKTMNDSIRLTTSANFISKVNQELAEIKKFYQEKPSTRALSKVNSFLEYNDICSGNVLDWMFSGCAIAKEQMPRASLYLKSTIIRKINDELFKLPKSARKTEAMNALESNDVTKAVRIYEELITRNDS